MPWIRRADEPRDSDGIRPWKATITWYEGGQKQRLTKTFDDDENPAREWAYTQLASIRRGDWIDPRNGEVTVAQFWEQAQEGRGHLEAASIDRDASHYRCHVAPKWGGWAIAAILKPDINGWVKQMVADGVNAW